ncbi:MAG: hypothetical protein J6J36_00700 [Clostridia bacterium]|nr:hypothetical protein [Clostridia bacterium]
MINKLEKIFEAYLMATGKNPQDCSIRMGVESDWLCSKAKSYLDMDKTGLLSILTMIEAYKTFIKEHQCTIEDLINGEWDDLKPKFDRLRKLLYEGEVGEVYNKFINLIIKHASVLGKNYTKEDIEKIKKIENIITKAIEKFNNKYSFKHEKFSEGETKINKNVTILPRLYRFQHLKLFVDKMKNASEDNFICMALIDRTNEKIEDEYYDNNLDSFFAFGFKNNGTVWVVSDRVTYDSPEGAFKSRNPGRAMRDKIDYDWLPYYNLDKIKQSNEHVNQILLPFNNNARENGHNIVDLFDDEGIIYSTLIMTLIYNKYFCNSIEENFNRKYFSSEVKLLPHKDSKTLVSCNELQLPIPPNNIKAYSYRYEGKSYSNSIFDYLIDQYPLKTELPTLKSFIGDKETVEKYIWWNIRKQQKDHIETCLKEQDNYEGRKKLEEWQRINITKNIKSIIKTIIETPDRDGFKDNYKNSYCSDEKDNRKMFWESFRDDDNLDTYSLKTFENEHKQSFARYDGYTETDYGNIYYSLYGTRNYIWFANDNDRKYCEIELILRSHSDLEKFFNLANGELPKVLSKHFYSRSGAYSLYSWKPYTGNSILEFTDPMNEIRDPFEDFGCHISIVLSKSKLKELKRKINKGA